MQTVPIDLDRTKARALYRDYRKHVHWSKPIDRECMRAYQLLAQGRLIIQALESVKAAGLNTEGDNVGLPRLGLCRADAVNCNASIGHDGSLTMSADDARTRYRRPNWTPIPSRNVMSWPAGSFVVSPNRRRSRATALVPTPPLHLRPKRALQNYHVLWEATWSPTPPSDPFLLRRIGQADLWLVLCQWDLSPVEKAALSTRVRA
jgi:hypothetical protein